MKETEELQAQVAQWRAAFDRAFAEPPPEAGPPPLDFLGLGLGAQPHALRLAELSALQALAGVTPYPGAPPELLGLVSHRGVVLPLYDLRALLGLGAAERPAWLVVLKQAPLALAFERFDGHWRLPGEACVPAGEAARDPLRGQVLRCPGESTEQLRPVIDLGAVAALLRPPNPS